MKLGTSASEVKESLNAEFASQQNNSTYKTVMVFLEAVEKASGQNVIDDLLVSGGFNADRIVESVEQLLQQ